MRATSTHERIQRFERIHRTRGLPLTIQRRAVFEAIADRRDHPTADQVYAQVRGRVPGLSRATVYRILDKLVELGLIVNICHLGSAARYDAKLDRHDHLVCLGCGKIIDLEDPHLDHIAWPDVRGHGFDIHDYHIHFRGLCTRCRGRRKKGGDATPRTTTREAKRPAGRRTNQETRQRRTST